AGRPKPSQSSPPSPGCCTATKAVSPSRVKRGPQGTAPTGTGKKGYDVRSASHSVTTPHRPSGLTISDGELPSVATHSRPTESMAQLSGMPNQPFFVVSVEKEAPTSATEGSPHFNSTSQRPLVAAKSPPSSAISMI